MLNNNEIYKDFLNLFINIDLNISISKLCNKLKLSRATFYNKFFDINNLMEKSFEYYFKSITNKRIQLKVTDLMEIIPIMNKEIFNKVNKIQIGNYNALSKNISLFNSFLKDKYFKIILRNFIKPEFNYLDRKIKTMHVLELAYFNLIYQITNKTYDEYIVLKT